MGNLYNEKFKPPILGGMDTEMKKYFNDDY
jgi:hypothetical protein